MSPPGTDPATPPPESPHPKTRPGGTKKGKSLRRLEREGRAGRVSVTAVLEVRPDGQESGDISLPRHLGLGMRRLDTGGGRGPSGRRAQNAARSRRGELVGRLRARQRSADPAEAPVVSQVLALPTRPRPSVAADPPPGSPARGPAPTPAPCRERALPGHAHPAERSPAPRVPRPGPSGLLGSAACSPFTVNLASAAPPPRPESPGSALHT